MQDLSNQIIAFQSYLLSLARGDLKIPAALPIFLKVKSSQDVGDLDLAQLRRQLSRKRAGSTKSVSFQTETIAPPILKLQNVISRQFTDNYTALTPRTVENTYGMLSRYYEIYTNFAKSNFYAVILREANPSAPEKHKEGAMGKNLITKAKTADDGGPIDGFIPAENEQLSKLRNEPNEYKRAKIQKETLEELTRSKEILHENPYLKSNHGAPRDKLIEEVHKLNKEFLTTTEDAKTKAGEVIFTFSDENNKVLFDNNGKPRYFIKKDSGFVEYSYASKNFEATHTPLPPDGYSPKEVKILAYLRFEFDEPSNSIKQTKKLITADFDQLASSSQLVYEYIVGGEGLSVHLNRSQINKRPSAEEYENAIRQAFLNRIKAIKEENRTLEYIKSMGLVNEIEKNVLGHLSPELDETRTHGNETENPYPEPWKVASKNLYFNSDGKVKEISTEQDHVDLFNQLNKEGFIFLTPNAKWDWQRNEEGILYKINDDQQKIQWSEIASAIKKHETKIESLEETVAATNLFDMDEPGLVETIKNRLSSDESLKQVIDEPTRQTLGDYATNMVLYELAVNLEKDFIQIRRLLLESDVYFREENDRKQRPVSETIPPLEKVDQARIEYSRIHEKIYRYSLIERRLDLLAGKLKAYEQNGGSNHPLFRAAYEIIKSNFDLNYLAAKQQKKDILEGNQKSEEVTSEQKANFLATSSHTTFGSSTAQPNSTEQQRVMQSLK